MSDIGEGHVARRFDSDLATLRLALLEMAGLVLSQADNAVNALTSGNDALAREVMTREPQVDAYEDHITDEAVRVLAQRAPVAVDLRIVITVGRAVRDLERIGDEARKIARCAIEIHGAKVPLGQFYRDVGDMSRLVLGTLHDAIQAVDNLDATTADSIRKRDKEVDAVFDSSLRHLASLVIEDQRHLGTTINTVFVLKALERIGDHAKNLAEGVAYLLQGRREKRVAGSGQ
jgi:phosphate transport system protein